jgi:hypothetical protein
VRGRNPLVCAMAANEIRRYRRGTIGMEALRHALVLLRKRSDEQGVVVTPHAMIRYHPLGQLIIDNQSNPSPMRYITRRDR